ncbi:MAG TPA: exodeoxyribonuclease VII small subunit [Lachnospiraceae bacterium]|jgi:exodeoxyribonuclease VII small subunit|nr:exodeoxyribonuclease VII small subunit [Lachnospiraceae bacterium]
MSENTKTAAEPENEKSLEEMLQELNAIVERMQSPDSTLEQSFRDYERGMSLLKTCNDRIDRVEKQVKKIAADGSVSDFTVEEDK